MPTIKERLQEDWKVALKAKEKFKASVISTAKSAILLMEKNDGVLVDDTKAIEIIAREIKQRREAILEFQKGNRQDLVDQNNAEIQILLEYLPKQLSEEEILKVVTDTATEIGANNMKDMGKLMSAVRPKTVGKADGKIVSQIVKDYLNNK